jgi:pimeloyl-ACP methyl ester carboxylesterase
MSGYAQVNGLRMYYEIHGDGDGRPLVLLHGGMSGIESSFGTILPLLAKSRRVIGVELQGHGRTADIDRPLRYATMASDVVAFLDHLGIESADIYGYSVGGAVAIEVALQAPSRVGKLVLASVSYALGGLHPGVAEGIDMLTPENMVGSPWEEEYLRISPDPEHWPILLRKIQDQDRNWAGWSPETIQSITAPVFLVLGDSDIVTPEHAVAMFRLFGGGVIGEMGLAASQLVILPGTAHSTVPSRGEWLAPMIDEFLER